MRRAEKLELMIGWFGENFEDPAHRTPYETREGGYQWIWGGPHDAREQLSDTFGNSVSETLIDEAVEEVEAEGITDWAPTPDREDYDEGESPDAPPLPLDTFLDEPGDAYGSAEELAARAAALVAVDQLRQALEKPVPIGIGHNHPPPDEEEPDEIRELHPAMVALGTELAKPQPAIQEVKKWSAPLRKALIATGTWFAKKLDKAADAAMSAAGVAAVAYYSEPLKNAFEAVIKWLALAARQIF
jgi:hypothetical protein